MRWDVLMLGALLAGILAWLARRDHQRASAWRTALFDDCRSLLARSSVHIDRTGWPVLEGTFEDVAVSCALILDDAGVRKLPVLWLSVTLAGRLQLGASFDALAREQGTEFFSPAAELDVRLPLPEGWPPHVTLRADRTAPLPEALARLGREFFALIQAKEIVSSPRGVRLVSLAAEGRRAEYLMLRRSRFDIVRVDPSSVAARLSLARDLVRSAESPDDERRAA